MALLQNQALVHSLRQFWFWWTGELEKCVPRSVTAFFTAESVELRIVVEDSVSRLELITARDKRLLSVIDIENEDGDKLASLRQKALSDVPGDAKVTLFIPSSRLLVHQVMLPIATELNLGSVLKFELDRLTPFKPGQASFGYRALGRYPEHEKIMVELLAARQDYLDLLLDKVKALGLSVSAILPASALDEDSRRLASMNLLAPDMRPKREGLFNFQAKKMTALAAVLLLLVCLYPAWQLNLTRQGLQDQIDSVQKQATEVSSKQAILASRLGAQDALSDRKNNLPTKLEIVQEITRLLPDNTWVSRLNVTDSEVTLQGESRKASDLIELLEQSDYFQNVSFGSSVVRNPSTNMERYEIRMELTNA